MNFNIATSTYHRLQLPKSIESGPVLLGRDVESFKSEFTALKNAAKHFDHNQACRDQSLLAVLSAVPKSEGLLRATIPHLIESADKAGKKVFLILGCNQGEGFSNLKNEIQSKFECDLVEYKSIARIHPDVYGPFFHTADNHQTKKGQLVFKLPEISNSKHQIVICGQERSLFSSGKSKMLDDIFGIVVDSIFNGWSPPKNLLMLDDDTRFVATKESHEPKISSSALQSLLETSRLAGDKGLVGAKWLMTPFESHQGQDHPTFLDPSLPHYDEIEFLQGQPGFNFLVGGALLGETISLTALYRQVCAYSGSTMEDFHLCALAKAAGYKITIPDGVLSTNFIHADESRALKQLQRWMKGIVGLENLYGKDSIKSIFDTSKLTGSLRDLYIQAFISPNDILNGSATWNKGEG